MEYGSQEISVRVITCSDHSSAAWKQMMRCSEIRVFSHCIRHSFLGGWPGGPLCIGRSLLFRLCLTTSVSVLGIHLLQINPASVELQAYRPPLASIQPPTCHSHGLLITGICVWALFPQSPLIWANTSMQGEPFSKFFIFLSPAAMNSSRFPQERCHCLRT